MDVIAGKRRVNFEDLEAKISSKLNNFQGAGMELNVRESVDTMTTGIFSGKLITSMESTHLSLIVLNQFLETTCVTLVEKCFKVMNHTVSKYNQMKDMKDMCIFQN